MIWPNMARPKIPPLALVPAYRSQLPTSSNPAVVTMAGLGPPLLRTQMTKLERKREGVRRMDAAGTE